MPTESAPINPDPFWAVVEVMGHSRHIGQAREVIVCGVPMLEVSTPEIAGDPPPAKDGSDDRRSYYLPLPASVVTLSAQAIFRITRADIADCLRMLRSMRPIQYVARAVAVRTPPAAADVSTSPHFAIMTSCAVSPLRDPHASIAFTTL
jgi:hypothetical protein